MDKRMKYGSSEEAWVVRDDAAELIEGAVGEAEVSGGVLAELKVFVVQVFGEEMGLFFLPGAGGQGSGDGVAEGGRDGAGVLGGASGLELAEPAIGALIGAFERGAKAG
jgi:hypothetical protein